MSISRRNLLKAGAVTIPSATFVSTSSSRAAGCSTPTYLTGIGQVATSCHVPTTRYSYNNSLQSSAHRSVHFNRSGAALSRIRIAVPNFSVFAGTGAPRMWAARVEYPLGSINTVLWTEANPGTSDGTFVSTPDGLWSVSDELVLPTPIPDNAMFWVRLWQSADAPPPSGTLPGLLFHDLTSNLGALDVNGQPGPFSDRSISNRLGETNFIFNPFPAILDKPVYQRDNGDGTQTCLFDYWDQGDPLGAYIYWMSTRPLAILGPTQKPSFALWGDSRVVGLGDKYNGISNNRGEVERSIGNEFAYINFGISGLRADDFYQNTINIQDPYNAYTYVAKTYTTNLIEDLGGNDIIPLDRTIARTPDAVLGTKRSIWNVWTKPTSTSAKSLSSIATLTLPSVASAASGYWTTFDQTDGSGNPDLDVLNGLLRAGVEVRVFDVASVVSQTAVGHSGSSQYLWKPNTPAFTVDGIHESQTGCYVIHDSGVIDPYVLGS
ncbi:hypothetical protein [Bradyrhizobium commune]|uniref:Uncharacterized protein n=1 Tax=Bradyrhizobium commune TaxID=83627 RepID=A0A7S9D0N8_9BRAD|nr:hypothetical protein [Bradyrhizobium commune]QPF89048.1 hypothetical protein IC761_21300 [Bradyrhizobium commune]